MKAIKRGSRYYADIWDPEIKHQRSHPLDPEIKSQREADDAATALKVKLKSSPQKSLQDSDPTQGKSWKEVAALVIAEKKLERGISADWSKRLEDEVKRFKDFVGEVSASMITAEQAKAYAVWLASPDSPVKGDSTRRKILAFLRNVFKRAGNPIFHQVFLPAEPKGKNIWITPEQFQKLMEVAPSHRAFRWTLLAYTGVRPAEACKLRWRDVDLDRKFIQVTCVQKGSKPGATPLIRPIPIAKPLLKLLKERVKKDQDPEAFVLDYVKDDKRANNWERDLKVDLKHAGIVIPGFRPYALRHTFCSWLVSNDVELYTISKLAGHSTVKMTERYMHLSPKHQANAIATLDKTTEKLLKKGAKKAKKKAA